jgi:hypothetical protein
MTRCRMAIAFLAVLTLAVFGLASPAAAADGRFTIRLYGAPGLFSGGEINDVRGLADYYNYLADAAGFTVGGEYKPAHFGLEAGVDFIFNLTPRVGIGLGVGYLNAARESVITLTSGSSEFTQTLRPAYGSIPLRLGVFWTIPVSSRMSIALSAGPEIHFARASTSWQLDQGPDFIRYENDVTGMGFGFHGAAAVEIKLSGRIGLLLEIAGRYARFGGLTGTATYSDAYASESVSGTFYRLEIPDGPGFPLVMVYEEKPSDDATEVKLNLSGGSVRFGVVIHI